MRYACNSVKLQNYTPTEKSKKTPSFKFQRGSQQMNHNPLNIKFLKKKKINPKTSINFKIFSQISLS